MGKTLAALVAGHFPPLLVWEPEAEYQWRIPGLKPITSSRFACGKRARTDPSTRFTSAWPATLLQPTSIVSVTGSIQLPFPEQLLSVKVAAKAPVPTEPALGSNTSTPTLGMVRYINPSTGLKRGCSALPGKTNCHPVQRRDGFIALPALLMVAS